MTWYTIASSQDDDKNIKVVPTNFWQLTTHTQLKTRHAQPVRFFSNLVKNLKHRFFQYFFLLKVI